MASIIDSFRDVATDKKAFIKLIILAIPLNYAYQIYTETKTDFTWFWLVTIVTIFFLFGFLLKTINNVLSDADSILPSFNPFKIAFAAFKGLFAVLPLAFISVWLANYVCSLIYIIPWLDITLKVCIWLIVASVVLTSVLMFCTRERIADSYNLKLLSKASGDMIVTLIVFLIQLIVINLPTVGFIGYTLLILFGYGPVFNFFVALAIVFNVALIGHYMAQVHYELIGQ